MGSKDTGGEKTCIVVFYSHLEGKMEETMQRKLIRWRKGGWFYSRKSESNEENNSGSASDSLL